MDLRSRNPEPALPSAPHGAAGAAPRVALSVVEAACCLGVSLTFFEQHVLPELRVVQRGERPLIPLAEIQRWLDSSADGPGAGAQRPDRILTIDEAAELVNLSPRTIMRAIRAGQLVASQLNQSRGGWRIYESAVRDWMAARANVERAPRPISAVRRIDPDAPPRRVARRSAGQTARRLVP